ncbi:MAG: hypothetical protein ABI790_05360 [Betaproteobacteria bacterium]
MKSIFYRDGYKYTLSSPFVVQTEIRPAEAIDTDFVSLLPDGLLKIRPGYAWDGATSAIDTPDVMRGALVHDALYQLMRGDWLDRFRWRDAADKLLRTLCLEDGMPHFRAEYIYQGVHLLGDPAADPKIEHPILQAPRDE